MSKNVENTEYENTEETLVKPLKTRTKKTLLEVPPPTPSVSPTQQLPPPTVVTEVTKPKKPRPPKSAKQLEQFELVRARRAESIEKKKLEKKIEASKILLEHGIEKPVEKVKKPKKIIQVEVSDSSSGEEIQYVKKVVKKPKAKTVVEKVYVEESESEKEEAKPRMVEKQLKSQQNKSSIKVTPNPQPAAKPVFNPNNFFI
jgi:hypothetical protein